MPKTASPSKAAVDIKIISMDELAEIRTASNDIEVVNWYGDPESEIGQEGRAKDFMFSGISGRAAISDNYWICKGWFLSGISHQTGELIRSLTHQRMFYYDSAEGDLSGFLRILKRRLLAFRRLTIPDTRQAIMFGGHSEETREILIEKLIENRNQVQALRVLDDVYARTEHTDFCIFAYYIHKILNITPTLVPTMELKRSLSALFLPSGYLYLGIEGQNEVGDITPRDFSDFKGIDIQELIARVDALANLHTTPSQSPIRYELGSVL